MLMKKTNRRDSRRKLLLRGRHVFEGVVAWGQEIVLIAWICPTARSNLGSSAAITIALPMILLNPHQNGRTTRTLPCANSWVVTRSTTPTRLACLVLEKTPSLWLLSWVDVLQVHA